MGSIMIWSGGAANELYVWPLDMRESSLLAAMAAPPPLLAAKNVVMRFEAEIKTRDKARVKSYARCEADAERIGAHNTSTCMYVSALRRSHCNFASLHQGFVTCFMAKPFLCG